MNLGQLPPELRRGQADARFVVHQVVRHLVTVSGDAPDEVGVAPRPVPDEKEGRPRAVAAQHAQQLRCRCGVRSVVDGERDVALAGGDGRDDP